MTLRIMATSDIHGALLAHDYFLDKAKAEPCGMIMLGQLIARLRQEGHPTLLLDNGDFLQGSPLTDITALEDDFSARNPHPVIAAMNALRYDAVGLGNHEFNFGLPVLDKALKDLDATLVTSNILRRSSAQRYGETFVLCRPAPDGPCVGILSVAPPQILQWDRLVLGDDIIVDGILDTLPIRIAEARGAGADLIVVLCHAGIGSPAEQARGENVGRSVAQIPGVDALILGHTHEVFPNPDASSGGDVNHQTGRVHNTPTVQPGAHGMWLGLVDLNVSRTDDTWHIDRADVSLIAPDAAPAGPIPAAVQVAHDTTLARIRTPVGRTNRPLHTYFARVANSDLIQVITNAQRFALEPALADSAWCDLPILSSASPHNAVVSHGSARFTDISAGPLAMHHAAELYPFPNVLTAVVMTGRDIGIWLNGTAKHFRTITPDGGAQPLLHADIPSYNFDVIDGLTYTFDLTGVPQVVDTRHNGNPVRDSDRFVVLGNSYRFGGAGLALDSPPEIIVNHGTTVHQAIIDYFKAHDPLDEQAAQTWGFAPIAGATGLFDTGAGAEIYAAAQTDRRFLGFHPGPYDGVVMGEVAFD